MRCRYLWMVHRDAGSEAMWQLAARGKELWSQEVSSMPRCAALAIILRTHSECMCSSRTACCLFAKAAAAHLINML